MPLMLASRGCKHLVLVFNSCIKYVVVAMARHCFDRNFLENLINQEVFHRKHIVAFIKSISLEALKFTIFFLLQEQIFKWSKGIKYALILE